VVLNVATTCGEGNDRSTLALGKNQDELVTAISQVNQKTVVSVVSPGAVLMPWSKEVPAIIESWLPGQEAGNALADLLFGVVKPSGRLHVTLPNKDNEVNFTPMQYPGVGHPPSALYSEGLLIGYRYYDAHQITPNFCFGHGLSYTSFSYDNIQYQLNKDTTDAIVTVSLDIKNTGYLSGTDTPQLYLTYPKDAKEPPKVLKGFQKVTLESDQVQTISFELSQRDLSIWDSNTHSWSLLSGEYSVSIGASSCDLRGSVTFNL